MLNSRLIKYNIVSFIKRNYYLLFIVLLSFITGLITGSISTQVLGYQEKSELLNFVALFFKEISQLEGGQRVLFKTALAFNLKYLILIWLLSISILGGLLIPVILFLQTFITGFTISFLLDELLLTGFFYSLIAILPHSLFLLIGIILASFISLSFIQNLIKTIIYSNLKQSLVLVKQYSFLMLLVSIFFIKAAFIESIIVPRLINLLNYFL